MIRTAARSVLALAVAGVASIALASPAAAAKVPCPPGTYPPGAFCTTGVGVGLGDQAPAPGKSFHIHINAGTFKANSQVTIQLHSVTVELGTFTTDSAGALDADVVVPTDFPAGAHTLTLGGVDKAGNPVVLSQAIAVVARSGGNTGDAGGGSGLPFTGAEIGVAALVGAGLVGAGGATLIAGRKRKVVTA